MSAKYKRKSWQEKLADSKGLPKVGPITGKMTRKWGTGIMAEISRRCGEAGRASEGRRFRDRAKHKQEAAAREGF